MYAFSGLTQNCRTKVTALCNKLKEHYTFVQLLPTHFLYISNSKCPVLMPIGSSHQGRHYTSYYQVDLLVRLHFTHK